VRPVRALLLALAASVAAAAAAVDVGGWMEHKARLDALAKPSSSPDRPADDCPRRIALAARTAPESEDAAAFYYDSGICHLGSERVARDEAAAGQWLARAAQLGHPLARRALLVLREARDAAAEHPLGWHCHELGLGRRLCHGAPALY
jgi:TPR repeat protein